MSDNTKTTEVRARALFGVALLILGAILLLGGRYSTDLSDYTFASEPVEMGEFGATEIDPNKVPGKIIIPALSIDLPVARSEVVGGYWEVHEDKAGWGERSGIPGEIGNQVIFAHAREGLFLPLRGITEGMEIYVLTNEDWHSYVVDEIKEVLPNDVEVIEPSEDERLTLYTCSGFGDKRRLIVVAKPSNDFID